MADLMNYEHSPYICSVGSLAAPLNSDLDCSVLSLLALANEQIIVGTEKGCYLTNTKASSESVAEIYLLQNREVSSICSSDANIVCIASQDEIFLFDSRTSYEKIIVSFTDNTDEINQIKCNNDGSHLIACDDTGESTIYDLRNNKVYRTLRRKHTNICSTVSYLPNRQDEVVTGGLDSQILLWDTKRVKTLQFLNTQEVLKKLGDDSVYMFNPPIVHSIDVSSDGQYLAAGLGNGTLQIFNIMKGKYTLAPSLLINKHSSLGVSSVHFTKLKVKNDDPVLFSGGNDGIVNMWSFPLQISKKKQVMPTNKLCVDEELKQYLLSSYDLNSKVNCLESICLNGKQFVCVGDQTTQVKLFELKTL